MHPVRPAQEHGPGVALGELGESLQARGRGQDRTRAEIEADAEPRLAGATDDPPHDERAGDRQPGVEPLDGVGAVRVGDHGEEGRELVDGGEPEEVAHGARVGPRAEQQRRPERAEQREVAERQVGALAADALHDDERRHRQDGDRDRVVDGRARDEHGDGGREGVRPVVRDGDPDRSEHPERRDSAERRREPATREDGPVGSAEAAQTWPQARAADAHAGPSVRSSWDTGPRA
ncbi:hypothetical protein GCM10025864_26310 [Luteimicrobium album]|uniref:Uncharacterized protein n=1 Tax=Luteimicrobium album TaxID=1054550 RepID=A0ABQ6I3Q3_9MICO|nr:hypothetical protein GCM10025864_26310 [Luteimicrobium album]